MNKSANNDNDGRLEGLSPNLPPPNLPVPDQPSLGQPLPNPSEPAPCLPMKKRRNRRHSQHPAVNLTEDPAALLDGLRRVLQFILQYEADFLCGTLPGNPPSARTNYRTCTRGTTIRTPLGKIIVRVPVLRYFHLRVPIAKRAKRTYPELLERLALIGMRGVTPGAASSLVRAVWTLELPNELLVRISTNLIPVLTQWRAGFFSVPLINDTPPKPRSKPTSPKGSAWPQSADQNPQPAAENLPNP